MLTSIALVRAQARPDPIAGTLDARRRTSYSLTAASLGKPIGKVEDGSAHIRVL